MSHQLLNPKVLPSLRDVRPTKYIRTALYCIIPLYRIAPRINSAREKHYGLSGQDTPWEDSSMLSTIKLLVALNPPKVKGQNILTNKTNMREGIKMAPQHLYILFTTKYSDSQPAHGRKQASWDPQIVLGHRMVKELKIKAMHALLWYYSVCHLLHQ